ncbi:hypothetical protein [Dyadobacter sandarakinus]|uniref:Uncharacterized protein n=1 Tax=Dyadobacter sandarakinus TaxID=2747268 RepID=A0ABX7I100_9BACT|nr:hypothetical protein [Dyadobacter sandarakinus]QRQ99424.1 hypothetical protein HWI92_00100 [Dyadobacter sandarakinus]
MKKIASIGLLVLLLYNMFGLSFAVFFFDKNYQSAAVNVAGTDPEILKLYLPSLPYSENTEIQPESLEGLIRRDGNFYNPTSITHSNDTLYVTLQSNQAARDHFFELAGAMQAASNPENALPGNPYTKVLKLLGSLLKIYIPNTANYSWPQEAIAASVIQCYEVTRICTYTAATASLPTPPPELLS